MFLWFPELFSRIEKYGGSPCSVPNKMENITTDLTNSSDCIATVNNNVYFEGFLTAAANLPGNIFTFLIIDRVNRNVLLGMSIAFFSKCDAKGTSSLSLSIQVM